MQAPLPITRSSRVTEYGSDRIVAAVDAPSIVIVMHDFASGGTEHVAIRMANEWARNGRRVTIFCGTEQGPLRTMVSPSVFVMRAPQECRRSTFSRWRLARALTTFVVAERPAIVFAPGNFHLPVLARFRAIDRTGAMTIGKLSNPIASHLQLGPLRGVHIAIQRRLFRRIDTLIAMSPALRDEAASALEHARILHAWEPLLQNEPLKREALGENGNPPFLAIGRLEHQKHFALAIKALALCRTARIKLMILGEGSQRDALERLALRLGVGDRVTFGGYRADIALELAGASALILCSRFEGYPAVAVEAIAAGVPVLATPCSPAIGEILGHDRRSRIVSAHAGAFAAAMDAIVGQPPYTGSSLDLLRARHEIKIAAGHYLELLDQVFATGRAKC